MTSLHSRREVLKGTAAIAAAAAVGHAAPTLRAHAQAGRGARIDGVLKQAVDAKEVPGVVAMATTDKGLLYEGAFGVRALDQTAAMTPDTVFRIASMTKAIATVAAMQLVEQGKLTLEGPVPNIDPTRTPNAPSYSRPLSPSADMRPRLSNVKTCRRAAPLAPAARALLTGWDGYGLTPDPRAGAWPAAHPRPGRRTSARPRWDGRR